MKRQSRKMLSERDDDMWWHDFLEARADVNVDGKLAFFDCDGKEITPLKYDAESCDSPKSR